MSMQNFISRLLYDEDRLITIPRPSNNGLTFGTYHNDSPFQQRLFTNNPLLPVWDQPHVSQNSDRGTQGENNVIGARINASVVTRYITKAIINNVWVFTSRTAPRTFCGSNLFICLLGILRIEQLQFILVNFLYAFAVCYFICKYLHSQYRPYSSSNPISISGAIFKRVIIYQQLSEVLLAITLLSIIILRYL